MPGILRAMRIDFTAVQPARRVKLVKTRCRHVLSRQMTQHSQIQFSNEKPLPLSPSLSIAMCLYLYHC